MKRGYGALWEILHFKGNGMDSLILEETKKNAGVKERF
jgi:hypothetical protein